MGKIKAQLNRIALRVADADKAVEDLSALLGVSFYGPYDDEGVGLRVALPKSGGIEIMRGIAGVGEQEFTTFFSMKMMLEALINGQDGNGTLVGGAFAKFSFFNAFFYNRK